MNWCTKTKHSEKVSLKYRQKRRSTSAETTERQQSPRRKRAKRKIQARKQVREQAHKKIKVNEKQKLKDDEGMWHNIIFHLVSVVITIFISNNNHMNEMLVALQETLMILIQLTHIIAPQDRPAA